MVWMLEQVNILDDENELSLTNNWWFESRMSLSEIFDGSGFKPEIVHFMKYNFRLDFRWAVLNTTSKIFHIVQFRTSKFWGNFFGNSVFQPCFDLLYMQTGNDTVEAALKISRDFIVLISSCIS